MGKFDNMSGFKNTSHDWLTYETLFNHRLFRRSNQQRLMGTYRIPLEKVRVILGKNLPNDILDQLQAAFFPDLNNGAQLQECAERPWEPTYNPGTTLHRKQQLNSHVVMPYNFRDNDYESLTIGTASKTRHRAKVQPADPPRVSLMRLAYTWPMWSTASRSCVVKTGRAKATGAAWQDETETAGNEGLLEGDLFAWPMAMGGQFEDNDTANAASFKLANLDGCFSIKTGVMYVGGSQQGGSSAGGKATLEENSILACLRSDYIAEVDRLMDHDPVGDRELLILPEILTITEDLGTRPGDGFQVRDLSRLRKDKVYFPALSIPYVGVKANAVDFDTLSERYAAPDSDAWLDFWREHYAKKLGIAKAKLLIRYGLQLGTPNSQNFLIEFNPDMTPTGRIVVHDVGDAMLHTEAIWALFGDPSKPVPTTLKNLDGIKNDILNYECKTLVAYGEYYPGETGGDHGNSEAYPAGTHLHWHYYSSLGKGNAVAIPTTTSTDPDARSPGWQRVLYVNAVWGLAHNRAYVEYLESELGLAHIPIDWTTAPKPDRYLQLGNDETQRAETLWREDVAWERAQAKIVHDALASKEGQAALRGYHDRQWLAGMFIVRLLNKDQSPVAGANIKYRHPNKATVRTVKTNQAGEIRVAGNPQDYRWLFMDYPNSVLDGWLLDLKLNQHVDFDFVKLHIDPA